MRSEGDTMPSLGRGLFILSPLVLYPVVDFIFRIANGLIAPDLRSEFDLNAADLGFKVTVIEDASAPIGIPMIQVETLGAGGGSIGWIDDMGLLQMGPQSAGSDPGPACYGRGGVEPTTTDVNLVLGYLNPDGLVGGRRRPLRRIGRLCWGEGNSDIISSMSGNRILIQGKVLQISR